MRASLKRLYIIVQYPFSHYCEKVIPTQHVSLLEGDHMLFTYNLLVVFDSKTLDVPCSLVN